jgi:aminopeptidase N
MTLHALRLEVGTADFFTIMRRWAAAPAGRPNTTHNFLALAERVSGQQLDTLFHEWLFTAHKPALTEAAAEASGPAVAPYRRPGTRR